MRHFSAVSPALHASVSVDSLTRLLRGQCISAIFSQRTSDASNPQFYGRISIAWAAPFVSTVTQRLLSLAPLLFLKLAPRFAGGVWCHVRHKLHRSQPPGGLIQSGLCHPCRLPAGTLLPALVSLAPPHCSLFYLP